MNRIFISLAWLAVSAFSSAEVLRATASSEEANLEAQRAFDGAANTRWSSRFDDDEWLQVEIDPPRSVAGVRIAWETAFGEKYRIESSMNGSDWRSCSNVEDGDGQSDTLFFKPVVSRYVRMRGLQRGTGWGYSIFEMKLYGTNDAPVVSSPAAMDGDPGTAWQTSTTGSLNIRLAEPMDLGGLKIQWGQRPESEVHVRDPSGAWTNVAQKPAGPAADEYIFFARRPVTAIRLVARGPASVREIELKGGEEQWSPLRLLQAEAVAARRGLWPKWLGREQEFWTIVGVPDDDEESVLGETGAFESKKGACTILPALSFGTNLVTWADVQPSLRLEGGYLPLPSVTWTGAGWRLDITAFGDGAAGESFSAVRYRFSNVSPETVTGALHLLLRPVQLNPSWQHGGFSPIRDVKVNATNGWTRVQVNGRTLLASANTLAFMATAPDSNGLARADIRFDLQLAPGETRDTIALFPLHQYLPDAYDFDAAWSRWSKEWEARLNRAAIRIPNGRPWDILRSNLAYILLTRDGPWLKPGPRNYNHSWIRDGALEALALLQFGLDDEARDFVTAFSRVVSPSGWVPFQVNENGSPSAYNPAGHEGHEYDGMGFLAYTLDAYFSYSGDRATAETCYPAVERAMRYARTLRETRMTPAQTNTPYFGLLPESNSHEGYYPAMHSYWDDFAQIGGLKSAARLALALGHADDAARYTAEEDDLRACTYASMLGVIRRDGLAYVPGCVEKGDFDATSTSLAWLMADEGHQLPSPHGLKTFERYCAEVETRVQPGGMKAYTPYEARNAEALVRMGEPARARMVLDFLAADAVRPAAWNHVAEVVHVRTNMPSYIGDMPHTWAGADFVRAVRSLLAFEEEGRLVLAAGVDPAWLDAGVSVSNLPTLFGTISYSVKRDGDDVVFNAEGGAAPPRGFALRLPGRAPEQFEKLPVRIAW